MEITMIAAMDRNRVIGGASGGIPWHLPRDAAHFRARTRDRHMVLGRVTFEEMEGWFTTQTPIVLTRDPGYRVDTGIRAASVESAIAEARARGETDLVIAGGASVYASALPHATRLVLTLVDTEVDRTGASFFPMWEEEDWIERSREEHPPDEENVHALSILTLIRVRSR